LTCVGPPPPAPQVRCSPIADHFTLDDHVLVRPCDTLAGTSCMVSCDILDGYQTATGLLGAPFVCGPDGEWTGALTCVGTPPPPAAGCSPIAEHLDPEDHVLSLMACDTAVGTHCMVGCDMRNGYSSAGVPGVQYVCGADGEWSGSLTCVGPPSPPPAATTCALIASTLPVDSHTQSGCTDTSVGSSCLVGCDMVGGFMSTGPPGAQYRCGPDGQWHGSLTCVATGGR
jgi:hypothetical protein